MMNIALLQMAQPRVQQIKQNDVAQVQTNSNDQKSFNTIFNDAVSEKEMHTANETEHVSADVVAEAKNLQELFDSLGIEYDESMLFVDLNGELIAIDQLLNLEDITQLLGMTADELQQIVAELTEGEVQVTDIWSLLEQAPEVLAHIMSTLNGEANAITPKDAGQVVNVLKLATMLGQKTDMVYSEEVKLANANKALHTLTSQLQQNANLGEQTKGQSSMNSFAKIVQVKSEANSNTSETQPITAQTQQNTATTRTVTVALPMERSQQSEALVKEIQNLLNRSQLVNNGGTIKLMLKLFPENLGQIRIEIMQQDGIMQARLLATTAAGKELLDSNLNQLKNAFVAHNIQMERIDIAQSLQNADQNLRDQGFFNQFFRQKEEDVEEETKDEEESVSFEDVLEEEIKAEEV